MEKTAIEFCLISDAKEEKTQVRRFFRIPVSDRDSVRVRIGQKEYGVSNISRGGIGIGPGSRPEFGSGEILADCELILAGDRISGLTGKIIHCSSADAGPFQYGIQWVDLQTGQARALDAILSRMKIRVLENNDRKLSKIQETER